LVIFMQYVSWFMLMGRGGGSIELNDPTRVAKGLNRHAKLQKRERVALRAELLLTAIMLVQE